MADIISQVDYYNQLIAYGIQLLGVIKLYVLRFLLDDQWTTITGCPCAFGNGANRVVEALARGDRNHTKDGIL